MKVIICILLFFMGAAIASFLNVVTLRRAKKEQFVKGRSHCVSCGEIIRGYDLIPVISYLFLRGKCRHCGTKISIRYFLVEITNGALFVFAFLTTPFSINLIIALLMYSLLTVACFNDIFDMEIPYWVSIGIAVLGILAMFTDTTVPFYEHLIGMVIISVPFAIIAFFGGMGGGDVQLIAAAGLVLGRSVVPAAAIGIVLGAIYGVISKFALKQNKIFFAPFLSLGIVICYPFGMQIINWYLGLMGF